MAQNRVALQQVRNVNISDQTRYSEKKVKLTATVAYATAHNHGDFFQFKIHFISTRRFEIVFSEAIITIVLLTHT